MASLSVRNLYELTDDKVRSEVQSVFLGQLQSAPSVHGTFFASLGAPPMDVSNPSWVDDVATALVCSSISRSSLYGFSNTIDQSKADGFWETQLALANSAAIQAGRVLYDWAFPAYCQSDGTTFGDYLKDKPGSWAQQLATHVTSAPFIDTEIAKLLAQDPNWLQRLNLVFYKLYRLDPGQVSSVVKAWVAAFPDKGIAEQWQSYNFVPSNLFQPDDFLGVVNTAIASNPETTRQSMPVGTDVCTTTYGEPVVAFITGTPARLGLTTEQAPANFFTGCGSCFVAGTPVHLQDGGIMPIERIGKGHKVLAQDGAASERSEEDVIVRFDHGTAVYGINDVAPFFTPGHLFWTKEGWKAVDPCLALDENPDREVGKLAVGDVVLRLKSTDPLAYEEVTVNALPSMWLPAGSEAHDLHLSGPPSYHAHGFLVSMNYPQITAKRLRDGLAKLSPSERAWMGTQLEPILALLSHHIAPFIDDPLQESLR